VAELESTPVHAKNELRIGLLVESLSDRFWQELVLAVDAAARRRGVRLYVFIGGALDGPELASRQANRCYQLASPECIDGLLVAPLGSAAGPERLAQYFERYRPLPMCAITALFERLPSVCSDNVRSMKSAVLHLIDTHGAQRVAFTPVWAKARQWQRSVPRARRIPRRRGWQGARASAAP